MSYIHAVIWIDHREAHIIQFDTNERSLVKIEKDPKAAHLHHHRGTLGSGKAVTSTAYLKAVIDDVADAKEVLVLGPGSAKLELLKYAQQNAPAIAEKILGVETVDHPTDPQLLAYAKKCFLKIDNLVGDDF